MEDGTEETAESLREAKKRPELAVPRKRLWKAQSLLERCPPYEAHGSDPLKKNRRLLAHLAHTCPAWVAHVDAQERRS